ncbi:MAG TPA: HlyD family efflux transporter periplasmic adaptor subunit [Gemmatimonadaceae bacterium]
MKFDRDALQTATARPSVSRMDVAREAAPKRGRRFIIAGAGVFLVAATVALTQLKPAIPAVDRSTLIIDSVRRGDMVREVRGPGTLVPEQVRWISALTSARVEKIVAQPGQTVDPGTVLLEMSNPDVQIQALQAQQALNEAQSRLVDLRVQLEGSRLTQEGAVATARTANVSAAQEKNAADTLLADRLISRFEYNNRKALAEESNTRLTVEQKRLDLMTRTVESQLAVQQRQIQRLQAIAAFQEGRVRSMVVYAGEHGVLQELSLQPGQWVNAGAPLAKIVQPGRLKAVLRIGEIQAKDVALGQTASIDTRNGIVAGHVSRMDPASQGGTVTIDVAIDGALPAGARPDLNVDGIVQLERLRNIVFTGRPSVGDNGSMITLFRLDPDGKTASRVAVRLGRVSASSVEIAQGLNPGDRVILSDLALPDNTERIRIK